MSVASRGVRYCVVMAGQIAEQGSAERFKRSLAQAFVVDARHRVCIATAGQIFTMPLDRSGLDQAAAIDAGSTLECSRWNM